MKTKKEKKSEYNKQYREKNKERLLEYSRRYYHENKEKSAEYSKQYREKNKEKITEHNKRYWAENKETLAEQNKQYREENREKISKQRKQYREKNKEAIAERQKKHYHKNKEYIIEQHRQYRNGLKENIIYKVICPDKRYYIGSTTRGIQERLYRHFSDPRDKKESLPEYLRDKKYTREDIEVEVLEKFESGYELDMREREYEIIAKYINDPFCLNKRNFVYGDKHVDNHKI